MIWVVELGRFDSDEMESFGLFFCNVWNDGIALLLGLVGGCFGGVGWDY